MLHYTKTSLDLIWDIDMLLFLENGIRGGVSYAGLRYAENNDSNTEQEQYNFLYLDANNLVSITIVHHQIFFQTLCTFPQGCCHVANQVHVFSAKSKSG